MYDLTEPLPPFTISIVMAGNLRDRQFTYFDTEIIFYTILRLLCKVLINPGNVYIFKMPHVQIRLTKWHPFSRGAWNWYILTIIILLNCRSQTQLNYLLM